jgi:hypothetical protein
VAEIGKQVGEAIGLALQVGIAVAVPAAIAREPAERLAPAPAMRDMEVLRIGSSVVTVSIALWLPVSSCRLHDAPSPGSGYQGNA